MRNQCVIFTASNINTDEKMSAPIQENVVVNAQSSILSEPVHEKNEVLKGRREGHTNYTNKKLRLLLNIINIHMPYGADQWQVVADAYNQAAKENRTAKSVKDKFLELVKARKPTGEGEKSRLIEDAQRLHDDITAKFNGSIICNFPAASSSISSATAPSDTRSHMHITPPTEAVLAAATAANSFSFESSPILSDSPRSFNSSPSASPSSISSDISTSRKRKLEDAIISIAENACKKAATNESVLATVLDKVMGTVERMQKQQQEWIENLLLKQMQINKGSSVT